VAKDLGVDSIEMRRRNLVTDAVILETDYFRDS
jgi:hypothetical protein